MKKILVLIVVLLAVVSMLLFGQDPDPGPDPEQPSRIWQILSGILLVATMFFGSRVNKLRLLVKEALDLLNVVLQASADGNFDANEQANIAKEAKELRAAWRGLLGKII